MDEISKDDRFSKISKDPRFRRIPKKEKKVKIDKRFKDMFTDKKFKLKYSVDKRGRPVNSTTNENFRKYYDISDSEDEDKIEDISPKQVSKSSEKDSSALDEDSDENKVQKDLDENEEEEDSDENKPQETADEKELLVQENSDENEQEDSESEESDLGSGPDLARGEGNLETSSEEEESDNEDIENDDDLVTSIADLDRDAVEAPEITRRLAVCNMDWDRVKAKDIFVLLQSFKPTGGLIQSVKIYPSEIGLERMKIEAVKGPIELTEISITDDTDHDGEDTEGGSFHTEKLRKYQLNRLKYYYAVVECDSPETANKIYEECDNMEYESSSNKLDLRFIPDDMTFEHEPKTVCTELPTAYNPSLFFTTALCQSKVDLTWDETDHERLKVTMNPSIGKKSKKGKDEIKEEDYKAYLASSSEEEDEQTGDLDIGDDGDSDDEDEDKQIDKYRNLVQNIKESEEKKKKRDIEMEITWEPGLKESTEKMVKKKDKEKGLTVWEKYLEKKKEKKQNKRKENKKNIPESTAIEEDNSESDQQAFSDDDVPDDIKSDPFFQDSDIEKETKNRNKGKKKSKQKQSTDEKELREKNEAELSLLMMDEDNEEDEKKHFSLKKLIKNAAVTKKKKKKIRKGTTEKVEDDFKVDITDPRFDALYTSHMYNIDPSVPEYKKTKGTQDIVQAKQKYRKKDLKRKLSQNDKELTERKTVKLNSNTTKDTSLQKLVESVKMKTKQYKNKK